MAGRPSSKKPVVNQDLWDELDEQVGAISTEMVLDQGPRLARRQ